ncbi:MAG: YeaH/YhbH family protein, partial [Gammaproteobacteria bacterium]
IRRYRRQIKEAITRQISQRSIQDLESGESVAIPTRDISEPVFRQGAGGRRERVLPGNKKFQAGDRVPRPTQGGGSGHGRASDQGEGEDEFAFQLTKDEYLDLLFDGLALPNLRKTQTGKITETKTVRAGFKSEGNPSQINIVRSLRHAMARRMAMTAGLRREKTALQERLETLEQIASPTPAQLAEMRQLREDINEIDERIRKVPFIDTFDLRYNNYDTIPIPSSQAVMFCIMDVSGSMDQATKDIAKRFFLLLYLFLTKNYDNVDIVFIRHHTRAKEVDENEFFYSRETGGTIVSSALELSLDIIQERYDPETWNIYIAQASDGDNWHDDTPRCQSLLAEKLLPVVRYFTYIEITERAHQSLWEAYAQLQGQFKNFAIQHIRNASDIYPVFRELFSTEVR